MFVYQIIHQVYEKFRGLPVRLAERANLSPEWFRSHGYVPRTLDASGNGNTCSEVENYLKKCEEFEAAATGAGQMLNQIVYAELNTRFGWATQCSQRELRREGLKEAAEAISELDKTDFQTASDNDLMQMNKEICDVADWVNKAQARIHREMDKRQIKETYVTNGHTVRV